MKDLIYVPPTQRELDALVASPEVGEAMGTAAEAAQAYAEANAPVDTGDYRSRFRVERDKGEARLINDDEAAAVIEWGGTRQQGHFTLTQAADQLEADA